MLYYIILFKNKMSNLGRKSGCQNKNYNYCVVYLNNDGKIQGRKYFKTHNDLNQYFPISKATLWRILKKDGITKKYRWNIFEKVKIAEELGDFFNKTNTC